LSHEAWKADPAAKLLRRLGKSPQELKNSPPGGNGNCPDMWLLDNGDVAVIGHDLTDVYRGALPSGASISPRERLVIIPGNVLRAAKPDIPNA
jgi:hypothetical protein